MPPDSESSIMRGRHVMLRPIQITDAEVTYEWRRLDRARMLGGAPGSVEQQREWIASRSDDEVNWIVELSDGLAVGMVSLLDIDFSNSHAQSGRFLIGREEEAQGRPVAVEAMLLLYEYAFETLGIHRVYGYIAAENAQMIRWQEYLGMRREGVWRQHLKDVSGGYTDAVLLGLLAEEYVQRARPRMQQLLKMAENTGRGSDG